MVELLQKRMGVMGAFAVLDSRARAYMRTRIVLVSLLILSCYFSRTHAHTRGSPKPSFHAHHAQLLFFNHLTKKFTPIRYRNYLTSAEPQRAGLNRFRALRYRLIAGFAEV